MSTSLRKALQREIEQEFKNIGNKQQKNKTKSKEKKKIENSSSDSSFVSLNVRRILDVDRKSKVSLKAEESIIKDQRKKKKGTENKGQNKRKRKATDSSVFTEEDFENVGEFIKSNLIKNKK